MAAGYWGNYGGKSSASASVNGDGTISLIAGSVDIGGTRTSLAMQLAETLGIPAEDVRPSVADTDSIGYTEGTYGSRTTFATGWAVYESANRLKEILIERAAILAQNGRLRIDLPDTSGAQPSPAAARAKADNGPAVLTAAEMRAHERANILAALASCSGKVFGPGGAAEMLDIKPTTLASRIKALGIADRPRGAG